MNKKKVDKDPPPDTGKGGDSWLGPRGMVLRYGRNIHGIVHRNNDSEYKKLKVNCYRLGLNLNYNGIHSECGWDYIVRWFNLTCATFIPFAEKAGMEPKEFVEDQLVQRMVNAETKLEGVVKHAKVNNKEFNEEVVSEVKP